MKTIAADPAARGQGGHHAQCIKPDWIPAGRAVVVSLNGEVEGRVDYVVSSDGGTLTLSAVGKVVSSK